MEKRVSGWGIFALSNRTNMFHTISWGEYFTVMGLGFGLYYGWWLVRFYPGLRMGRKGKAAREKAAVGKEVTTPVEKVLPVKSGMQAELAGQLAKGNLPGNNGNQAGAWVDGQDAENSGMQAAPTLVETVGMTANEVTAAAGEAIGKPDQAVAATGPATQQMELPLPVPAVVQRPVFLPMIMGDLVQEVWRLVEAAADEGMKEEELVAAFRRLLGGAPYNKLRGTLFEGKIVEQIVRELEKHGLIAVDAMVVSEWWT